jgi:hypothetical protein
MEAHALRADIPEAAFTLCRQVRKRRLHTRLEACVCFDICFLGASPLREVGLSAPIPRKRYGISTSIPCAEEAASAAAPSACRMWHIQQARQRLQLAGCVEAQSRPTCEA